MSPLSRRDLLKSGLAASLGALSVGAFPAVAAAVSPAADDPIDDAAVDAAAPAAVDRADLLLDFGWRFHLGNADDPARDFGYGRESGSGEFAKRGHFFHELSHADYDDSAWRALDLPHDWAVELPFVDDKELVAHGARPLGRSHPDTSIGWYRRVFEIPAGDRGKRLALRFDGIFRDAMISLNGHLLGRHQSGYTPVRYDITDVASYGGKNVLVVRVDATEYEGWFYEGAGIYRHVWLEKAHPVHVAPWGTLVTSRLRPAAALVSVATEIDNETDGDRRCTVRCALVDAAGATVARAPAASAVIPAGTRHTVRQDAVVHAPALWTPETPHLYRAVTTIEVGGAVVDRYETTFGIRGVAFDAKRGFLLNGKPVKILGTCNHQDHAGVGSAVPDRLYDFRVARLKEMGSNAWRTAHNPPASELLDACDRLGMLVLDETRLFASTPEGLAQLETMVRRDRNHPSIFAWSIANEEQMDQGNERGARVAATMKALVRRLDPSRPVTAAMDGGWGGDGMTTVLDVQGCNYHWRQIDDFHAKYPDKPVMGSETSSALSTRGIYEKDPVRGYVSAYDVNNPPWGSTAEQWWGFYATRDWLAGGFVWTGFDYRGEPTPYSWPCISSHFGIMDTCGFPKDNYFYYRAWWGSAPVLHILPHWNWAGREGQPIDVWCHTNLDRVELLLNGRSLGTRDVPRQGHVSWSVPYAPGVLEARGHRGDRLVLTGKRETTGAPAALALRADRTRIAADGEDVTVVEVRVVDAAGRVVPTASDHVTFHVTGPARIIGVGNGDPSSHEPDRAEERSAFNGLCAAIVQSTREPGTARIEASAPGIAGASLALSCEAATPRPAVA